jgi:tripartite-type tricarboxylate transporter receptor subunit TctC
MQRRNLLALGLMMPAIARAETERTSRLIVSFAAGGQTDILARIFTEAMGDSLGQRVIVENRTGAAGNVGAEAAARSVPDGTTMFFGTPGTHSGINAKMYRSLPFDPVRDFAPVALVVSYPNVVLVHPGVPARNLSKFIAWAKTQRGTLSFASAGVGTTTHLATELLAQKGGFQGTHIPYRGGAPAMQDLLGGRVPLMIAGLSEALPHIGTGAVRALAVTSRGRSPAAPDIPAVSETIPGFEAVPWFGLYVPAGVPPATIARLNAAANAALSSEGLRRRYAELGADPRGGTPEELAAHAAAETAQWTELIDAIGLKPE